jgi:hypothetical protein
MIRMGTLHFLLPPDLPGPAFRELERAFIIGGQDNMPFLTDVILEPGKMRVSRQEDESGSVGCPWIIGGTGTLLTSTATLIERPTPYLLPLELARGKVNQLRNQLADWVLGGLNAAPALPEAIQDATLAFGKAVAAAPGAEALPHAQSSLSKAFQAADQLVNAYIHQVFQVRHQRQQKLDTTLGIRLGMAVPASPVDEELRSAINAIALPMTWATVEPAEAEFHWDEQDRLFDWAIHAGYHVVGGPLIDCAAGCLPNWLWLWEKDLASIASFMCDYVEAVVKRYKGRIRSWQLTAGSNSNTLMGLGEEEMLWLTLRMAEAARQVDSGVDLVVGIAQPWGDYMAGQVRNHSPFVFADTLIRSGMNLAALDLELVMGVWPRGSYCRDLLEASRLLDLYALLGVPLQVTLACPSQSSGKSISGDLAISAGQWRTGFSPEIQADWATAFGRLALCKPSVRTVFWNHLSDAEPHLLPACGLVDAAGKSKPVMKRLADLRATHLR